MWELVAVAIAGFSALVLAISFIWWLVSWGRKNEGELRARDKQIADYKASNADIIRSLEGVEQTLAAERRATRAAERQRDEALNLAQALAAKSPAALTDAIRAQLQRLQVLVQEVPASATAESGGEAGSVHGPAAPD